ncbi:MAG TPA: phosphatase PAP2 family protein [Blastocatellia bacterium]|nr:phosphatase PAP2 family protein [Blastocatellia bacterium]
MSDRTSAGLYDGKPTPADLVVIAYILIIAALVVMARERIPEWRQYVAIHIAVAAAIATLPRLLTRRGNAVGRFLRGWYPVPFIPTTYMELRYLIPRIHPRDYDRELAAIDYRLFGAHPTVWLERFLWPPLTEIFQISYITYYFLPIALGAVLWHKGWFERYYFWVFIVVLGFYTSYLGYIAVPALGPRFLIADHYTEPLVGLLFFDDIRAMLDRAQGIMRDCFPSGHTEVTLLVLHYAYRFHRPAFWSMLPFGTALILSTVYLRYHYVIDLAAGAVFALAIVLAARPLYRILGGVMDDRRRQAPV